jgi:hypothetical protein
MLLRGRSLTLRVFPALEEGGENVQNCNSIAAGAQPI